MGDLKWKIGTLLLLFFSAGCKHKEEKTGYNFHYYPSKNVYYDVNKKIFWYSLDGAKNWISFRNDRGIEPLSLGKKIDINSKDSIPYNDNENHRKIYSGKLYALNVSNAELHATMAVAKERSSIPAKSNAGRVRPVTKKTKHGIGKLIDKIFGKHK